MGVDAEMFVKVRSTPSLTEARVRRLAWEMGDAFGPEKFWIWKEKGAHALTLVTKYEQDGPTIRPKDGEQFIRVHLMTRYYGPGYERGDLPLILMVAEWLEHRLPLEKGVESAHVWYGGDSSGTCATRFDVKARLDLFQHFVREGHRPYMSGWDLGGDSIGSRRCDFCREPMTRHGWGGNGLYASFSCHGCGLDEQTRDGGKTWAPTPKEDR